MKSIAVLLIIASSFFAKKSDASDIISAKALKSFETTFSTAKETTWTATQAYYMVQFILNGQTLTAFYNTEGNLLSVRRNLSSLDLPIMLRLELRKKYPDRWITDLFEVSREHGIEYYLTVENSDTKTILKSSNSTSWFVYQKISKS